MYRNNSSNGDAIPKIILITGANRGLGLGMVRNFLEQNSQLPKAIFATARKPQDASELNKLAETDPRLHVVQMDVMCDKSIEKAYETICAKLCTIGESGLNLLINNAGIMEWSSEGGLLKADRACFNRHFDTNVTAPTIVIKIFLPLLRKAAEANAKAPLSSRRAAIANMGSFLGSIELCTGSKMPGHDNEIPLVYRLTKTALQMLSKTLAIDLAGESIMSVTIHPGWVKTDMGGQHAPLTVDDSTKAMVATLSSLDEKSNGLLFDYNGEVLPF